ncbi:MAG TPA: SpoIID/LytB domain-containing protein, partial [Ardenticatenaceae bacterium]|nr:SpoIID/LytB domain-containing protein [Ardenticatenaceae bacterium]
MANVAVIRPVLRPRSWVLLLVVLVAVAGIAWLFGAARADTPVEAQFSSARDLVGLHWDAQGLRVAQVGPDGRARWSWLLPEAPDLDAIAQAPLSAAQPRAEVRYDGPHGEVHLDGHLILETDFEAVGAPVFAPNGQWFVVSRAPLGAETARLGELWRYDIPLERWTRLTYNNVEESSPAISPDGSQIAFLRDGTVWLRPAAADAPRRVPAAVPDPLPDMTAAAAAGALPQPATIRVLHVAENTCRPGVNVGDVTVVPFDEYVPGVLRQETIVSSWTDAALQANAVAERSYAWALTVVPKYPGQPYDIKDWVHDQAFCDCWWSGGRRNCRWEDPHYPRAVRLSNETSGQYIAHEGQVVRAYYGAENSSPTTGIPGHPVFQAKDDPPGFGTKVSGHGWGMGQWNSERWGREGWSYIQILRHFYSNTTVEQAAGTDAPPLFDLDTPWNGRYLTGSGLPLTAQATSASQPVTHVQFRAGWPDGGWVIDDTTGENGWATILRIESIPDLPAQDVSQALRIAGTAVDAAGRETLEVGPSGAGILAGIDRQPPSLSAALIGREGDTARFSVTTSDAGPSGVQGVGWSRGWGWQESQLGATAGAAVDDSAAVDGRAWLFRHAQDGAPSTTPGPHFTALPAGELYRAGVRLRESDTSSAAVVA